MAREFWIRGGGDDSNSGETYALAKRNFEGTTGALQLLTTKNDILNVVADVDYTWPTTERTLSSTAGTSYTDYGLLIRGVDGEAKNPAYATIKATGADGGRFFLYQRGTSSYWILRNIIFDATDNSADANTYWAMRQQDGGTGTLWIEYCAMLGGDSGVEPAGSRRLYDYGSLLTTMETVHLDRCYVQNCDRPFDILASPAWSAYRCLFLYDAPHTNPIFLMTSPANNSAAVYSVINCTIYDDAVADSMLSVMTLGATSGFNIGTYNIYNNLVWRQSTVGLPNTVYPFITSSALTPYATFAGTIGPNVLIHGPDVDATQLFPAGLYEKIWDANQDDATDPDHWASDTVAYGIADTAMFNDPTSTYDWEMPNGTTLTILKDLRPIMYGESGLYGDTPGALPLVTPSISIPPDDDPNLVPYLDTRPIYGDDLRMDINSSFSEVRNRVRATYARYDKERETWREYKRERRVIPVSSEVRIYSGLSTVKYMVITATSQAVDVSVSATEDTNKYWKNITYLLLSVGDSEYVRISNPSATATAEVIITEVG